MKIINKILVVHFFIILSLVSYSQSYEPSEPKLTSVSVIPESNPLKIKINWEPSDSLNVVEYNIFQIINGTTQIIGNVIGRLTTTYEYIYSGVYQPEKYRLAAINNQHFSSTLTKPHTSMMLSSSFEKCDVEINLNWTEYLGWENGVAEYRIWKRVTNSNYEMIGSVSGDILQFVDENVERNENYIYYIEAISSQAYLATSNSIEVFTDSYQKPLYLIAEYATVENEYINLKFSVDAAAEVLKYQILKKDTTAADFIVVKDIDNTGQTEIFYADENVDAHNYVYQYKIIAIDPCNLQSEVSNIASNILLKTSNRSNVEQYLTWTPYEYWETGINSYNIYNTFDSSKPFVGSAGSLNLDYLHNIEPYIINCHNEQIYITNKVCYYVEAERNAASHGQVAISRSNVSCAFKYPEIWIPTAFNATSAGIKNREFKPFLSFFEEGTYEMLIFDRWGEIIFRSTNVYEGWDGRIKNKLQTPQQYQYSIIYKDFEGKHYKKNGLVFMIVN
ncbi:gliding motility-associated C-terminal domain-containing protein [Bacteroidales bacterium OttesenSCG-928-I21]|nr:gliding motility-associated C-terminal domain-containing protein [Bacteroidales bacterium OttesenSCG-928-I21]